MIAGSRGEIRVVPCPPPLTALFHAHIQEFGVQKDGRLFIGERNDGELPTMTIGRMWRRARQTALRPLTFFLQVSGRVVLVFGCSPTGFEPALPP